MVVVVIPNHIAHGSLPDPGLISWWRVKVERLLLLRVRTRPIAPANPPLVPVEVPVVGLIAIFESDGRLDVRKSSSLVQRLVHVMGLLLEHHVRRAVETAPFCKAAHTRRRWVEVGARWVLIVRPIVVTTIPVVDLRRLRIFWRRHCRLPLFTLRLVSMAMRWMLVI